MQLYHSSLRLINKTSFPVQAIIAVVSGIILAILSPSAAAAFSLLGELFIKSLRSIAPILVLFLIIFAISNQRAGKNSGIRPLALLYFLSMFLSTLTATVISFLFPSFLGQLATTEAITSAPKEISAVLSNLVNNMIDNPIHALSSSNYMGLIVWGVILGIALRNASDTSKLVVKDISYCITYIVQWIIRLAPLGIFGLTAAMFADGDGFAKMAQYGHLLTVLVVCLAIVALIVNPLLVFIISRKNPYPLVFIALKESAIPAFFTRSSAANIPVNLALCKKLNFNEDTTSVAVPLGATVNMSGAAVTITVLTLAAVYSLGIQVDIPTALLLCIAATLCACGAAGVSGGSLLLLPISCSLFGISNEIAATLIGIGAIIGIIQDAAETAVNSSSDVVFIGAVHAANERAEISNTPAPTA